ncbi:hypothetical protein GLYMA_19G181250v4 [Glycine max]|nr:hypothetical protein GLYMA_19G181250v4 [Glycine max]KAH1078436.1 hypothetical protein GYH30_053439 [Glycine max]
MTEHFVVTRLLINLTCVYLFKVNVSVHVRIVDHMLLNNENLDVRRRNKLRRW